MGVVFDAIENGVPHRRVVARQVPLHPQTHFPVSAAPNPTLSLLHRASAPSSVMRRHKLTAPAPNPPSSDILSRFLSPGMLSAEGTQAKLSLLFNSHCFSKAGSHLYSPRRIASNVARLCSGGLSRNGDLACANQSQPALCVTILPPHSRATQSTAGAYTLSSPLAVLRTARPHTLPWYARIWEREEARRSAPLLAARAQAVWQSAPPRAASQPLRGCTDTCMPADSTPPSGHRARTITIGAAKYVGMATGPGLGR